VVGQIESAISGDPWKRNLDAIAYARELVLDRYQLFPFVVQQVRNFESTYGSFAKKQVVSIHPRHFYQSSKRFANKIQMLRNIIHHLLRKR
jgi:hypothetical protein